ncbi:MAG: ABC transporter substrate-binding protein [Nitrosopumilus sp. B06]|nr:MAG: ABC transporter substrate-binding protein [Nitrosopumilus sp. B06]
MKITVVVPVVLAGVIVLAVAAHSGGEQAQLRMAYFANVGHAIPIVGVERGFFEDVGVIETRIFDSGPQVIESMFAGSIDVAYVGPGPAINGFLNSANKNVQILAGAASGGASFVAHPDSDVYGISDFDGKRIAAPQIGNTQDVSLRDALSAHGLVPAERGGSVIIHNIPNPDIYTLFVKGEIDGAWVPEPWATILEQDLGGKRLFHEEELWPDGEFASVLLIANTDYVQKNPEIISELLRSHNYTASWINQNPAESRNSFNDFLNSYLGRPLPDRIVDVALANTEITADPKADSVYSFATKADKLGYLGRHGYDLSGIFYGDDVQ